MNNNSPVFIIGMPRSGTTLLSTILNSTSDISFPAETHFYIQKKKFYWKNDTANFSEFRDFYLRQNSHYFNSLNLSDESIDALKKTDEIDFFSSLMVALIGKEKSGKWGEKTPRHFMFLPSIFSDFANCKVINVVRDPRDVISSIQKTGWRRVFNIYEKLKEYKADVEVSFVDAYKQKLITVKYEDLICSPEDELNRICSFCKLQFNRELLLSFNSAENINFDVKNEPWKKNNLNPIDPNNAFKWKNKYDSFQNKFISWYCSDEIEKLNYEMGKYPNFISRNLYLGYMKLLNFILRKLYKNDWR